MQMATWEHFSLSLLNLSIKLPRLRASSLPLCISAPSPSHTHCSYIVIQGSTTLEHWGINLQFEPTLFEDPALGMRVHRGVYMVRGFALFGMQMRLHRSHPRQLSTAVCSITHALFDVWMDG